MRVPQSYCSRSGVLKQEKASEPGMEGLVVYFTDSRKTEQNFRVIHPVVLKF